MSDIIEFEVEFLELLKLFNSLEGVEVAIVEGDNFDVPILLGQSIDGE